MTKKTTSVSATTNTKKENIKKAKMTFLMIARQQAAKMHQQNIQMIKSSNMSKAEKAAALKKIKDAYCR